VAQGELFRNQGPRSAQDLGENQTGPIVLGFKPSAMGEPVSCATGYNEQGSGSIPRPSVPSKLAAGPRKTRIHCLVHHRNP